MTLIEQAQTNILALVTTAITDVADAKAVPVANIKDVFEIEASRNPMVCVAYEGFRLQGEQIVGRHGGVAQGIETWSFACTANDHKDALAASRKAWALVEAVRTVREKDYSPDASRPRYLRFAGAERPIASPERTARGGALGFVVTYESSAYRI